MAHPGTALSWLAEAFARHLANLASEGHRKTLECIPFEGLYEASVVVIADRIFAGLGFRTWPEYRAYEDSNQRADLWADSAIESHPFLVELKVIYDGHDNRLNRSRFVEKREILGDFDRLTKTHCSGHKVVVWLAFSGSDAILVAGKAASTMRLGDALAAIEKEYPTASLEAQTCVPFEQYCDCPEWKFGHLFCWFVR